ncbi:MJ1255/VC2487 family glycosyltransferase [Vibrio sp. SCSIO 43136]|uniref:MJ1255/VC2487 family glycosyltransferase n=1 Tax=Vibrio sp. SCSIO 43136 TaxID=2819101 RepID=UPI0020762D20|nr:MJ1255/VC2487 family glycosyltransferase [Vibrio sp. SCSIO 43136]USD64939.1 glycosyltransferase [Vibrio sp. SCSIO 43136]
MRILYGVQGTGNGHIARARAMAKAFNNLEGVDVDFLFTGRERDKYFSMDVFGDYQVRQGLSFITHQGKVDVYKTYQKNSLYRLWKEIREIDLSPYDLVISDFEPVSAWAAKRQNVTCIGLSHQNAFKYDVPIKDATWYDKWLIDHFAPSNMHIGLHWFHFDQQILPPIIDTPPHAPIQAHEQQILVYLPFESLDDIEELLVRFSNYQFVCYHPEVSQAYSQEGIDFYPLDRDGFQRHLHSCSGVIANGGFELPSEALSLGKKLLLKPLHGQFEQQTNVATLEELGLAMGMTELDPSIVRHWLQEPQAEPTHYPDVAQALADWIASGNWDSQQQLWDSLWANVCFPSYVALSN